MPKDALIILAGITADAEKTAYVTDYFRKHTPFDVFTPRLWQFFGFRWAARRLVRFLDRAISGRYGKCHFICYVSGGFILRQAYALQPIPNLGRIVYVRSPLQERVPGLAIQRYGSIAAFLRQGRILFDLASPARNRLPAIPAEDGVVLEQGVSAQAAEWGLGADRFEDCLHDNGFVLPPARDICYTQLGHDQVYTDDGLLTRMRFFLMTGRFSGGASNTPAETRQ